MDKSLRLTFVGHPVSQCWRHIGDWRHSWRHHCFYRVIISCSC